MGTTRDSPSRESEPASQFDLLYEKLRLPVYRVIRGIVLDAATAESLTQEAFERAYAARAAHLGDESAAWVYRIAVEVALARLRGPWWRRLGLSALRPARRAPASNSSQAERMLSSLTPRLRAAVVLAFYARLPRQELAATLQLPVAVVNVQLDHAAELMGSALSATDQPEGRERLNG
jgi:RNA polymerase sigma-70 factor (ECF subfamily)